MAAAAANNQPPQCSVAVRRLRLVETGEDPQLWHGRVRKQWGVGGQLAVRVSTGRASLGSSVPQRLDAEGAITWEAVGATFPLTAAGAGVLMLEVVCFGQKAPTPKVLGLATIDFDAFVSSRAPSIAVVLHVFPTAALSTDSVHALLDVALRNPAIVRGAAAGRVRGVAPPAAAASAAAEDCTAPSSQATGTSSPQRPNNSDAATKPRDSSAVAVAAAAAATSNAPLSAPDYLAQECAHASAAGICVTPVDLYFPYFLLQNEGKYLVSNVLCVENASHQSCQVRIRCSNGETLRCFPVDLLTVAAGRKAFASVTWNAAVEPGSSSSSSFTVSVDVLVPAQSAADGASDNAEGGVSSRSFSEQAQTPCSTNGESAPAGASAAAAAAGAPSPGTTPTSTQLPPPVLAAELVLRVHTKPPEADRLAVPYHYWVNGCAVTNQPIGTAEIPHVRAVLPVFYMQDAAAAPLLVRDRDSGAQQFVRVSSPCATVAGPGGNGPPQPQPHQQQQRSTQESLLRRQLPIRSFVDVERRACWCSITLGCISLNTGLISTIGGGMTAAWQLRFKVTAQSLEPQQWVVLCGESEETELLPNGQLRWSATLVLQKVGLPPSAVIAGGQFVRLTLVEVDGRGDETPVGTAVLSIADLRRVPSASTASVAFYMFDSFTYYDELPLNGVLMRGVLWRVSMDAS